MSHQLVVASLPANQFIPPAVVFFDFALNHARWFANEIEDLRPELVRFLEATLAGNQTRQALLLGLSFNLYRLKHRYFLQRMSTDHRTSKDQTTRPLKLVPSSSKAWNRLLMGKAAL